MRPYLAPLDRSDLDGLRDALEADGTRFGHPKSNWFYGQGLLTYQDLPCVCECCDALGLVDALPAVVATAAGSFSGVEADPDLGSEAMLATVLGEAALDRDGAFDGLGGCIEGDEEPIALVLNFFRRMLGKT